MNKTSFNPIYIKILYLWGKYIDYNIIPFQTIFKNLILEMNILNDSEHLYLFHSNDVVLEYKEMNKQYQNNLNH